MSKDTDRGKAEDHLRAFLPVADSHPEAFGGGGTIGVLQYGSEFVEVMPNLSLRRRYRHRTYERDLACYLDAAEANASRRPPKQMRFLIVFCKDVRVTSTTTLSKDGHPLQGTYSARPEVIATVDENMKKFSDHVFAYTCGEIRPVWKTEIIEKTLYQNTKANSWMLHPRALSGATEGNRERGDQLSGPLAKYEEGEFDFMVFHCDHAVGRGRNRIKPKFGGVAWTRWWLKGARTLSMAGSMGYVKLIHEWQHHIFDQSLEETEGLKLMKMHPSGVMGRNGARDLVPGWPRDLPFYRDRILYYFPRDMWRRWDIHKKPATPREAYSDKEYCWSEVKDDYWFKLPELRDAELRTLTGLDDLEILSEKKNEFTFFKTNSKDQVSSPLVTECVPNDGSLNNCLSMSENSAAVLRTRTGHFLFVKPDLADVYVDMGSFTESVEKPLPVCGYVLKGLKPLIVVKAPTGKPVPENELGYFHDGSVKLPDGPREEVWCLLASDSRLCAAFGDAGRLLGVLQCGKEYIEVTPNRTLNRRYRDRCYAKDLAAGLEEAGANARRVAPRNFRMQVVLLREARVTSTDTRDSRGRLLQGVFREQEKRAKNIQEGLGLIEDTIFAFSRGAIRVEAEMTWMEEPLHLETTGRGWVFDPRPVWKPRGSSGRTGDDTCDLAIFIYGGAHSRSSRTTIAAQKKQVVWPRPEDGRTTLATSRTAITFALLSTLIRVIDEKIGEHAGGRRMLYRNPRALGYGNADIGQDWAGFLAYYRDAFRYVCPVEALRRIGSDSTKTPRERFTRKRYRWSEVKDDYWNKLPTLDDEAIRSLTGLADLSVSASRGPAILFNTAAQSLLSSPRIAEADAEDTALNNCLAWPGESAAVLRTKAGHFLFVKPEMVDPYVKMRAFHGDSETSLPVLGCVMARGKTLIMIEAPIDLPVPKDELGYFIE